MNANMKIEDIINTVVAFDKLCSTYNWAKIVGITPQNANTYKRRFYTGSMSVDTMKKWVEKSKGAE